MSAVASGNFGGGGFTPGGFDSSEDSGGSGVAGAMTLFVLAVSAVAMWMGADAQRVLLTASLSMILFGLINFSPPAGISLTIAYLACVGGLKRYLIPVLGYTSLDPLLLVAPVVVIMFFINRIIQRNIPRDTRLAKLNWVFFIVLMLQVFNPLQGSLSLGFGGALFYLVPFLWYYCGRSFGGTATEEAVFRTILFVSVLGAIYGMHQQYVGFTEVEREWLAITRNDTGQYLVGGVVRVFSFFSSFAEYVHFVMFGCIVSFAWMLRRNRMAVIPLAFLVVVLVLSSSRGALLSGVFSLSVIWAVQERSYKAWGWRIVVAAVFGIAALGFGLTQASQANLSSTTDVLLEHQVKGVMAPLDKKANTGSGHINTALGGVMLGVKHPLGTGLGTTTIAGGKLGVGSGGEVSYGAEFDVGNVFVSCGVFGGILYTYIIGYVIWRAAHRWHQERSVPSLITLSIFVSDIGFWLMGAHYAETTLIWFLIGSLDRRDRQELVREQWRKLQAKAGPGGAEPEAVPGIPGRRGPQTWRRP